jgi:broad specificity phosphatase PhoE
MTNVANNVIPFIHQLPNAKIVVITHSEIIDCINQYLFRLPYSLEGDLSCCKNCNITHIHRDDNHEYHLVVPTTTIHLRSIYIYNEVNNI